LKIANQIKPALVCVFAFFCKISKLGQQKTTKNTIFDIKISEKVKNMQERSKAKKTKNTMSRETTSKYGVKLV